MPCAMGNLSVSPKTDLDPRKELEEVQEQLNSCLDEISSYRDQVANLESVNNDLRETIHNLQMQKTSAEKTADTYRVMAGAYEKVISIICGKSV